MLKKFSFLFLLVIFTSSILVGCGSTKKITLEKYNKVDTGMTYEQVVKIIGDKGIEEAKSEMPAIPGVSEKVVFKSYSWQNSDGTNMSVQFENDKVTLKAQAGLK